MTKPCDKCGDANCKAGFYSSAIVACQQRQIDRLTATVAELTRRVEAVEKRPFGMVPSGPDSDVELPPTIGGEDVTQ